MTGPEFLLIYDIGYTIDLLSMYYRLKIKKKSEKYFRDFLQDKGEFKFTFSFLDKNFLNVIVMFINYNFGYF